MIATKEAIGAEEDPEAREEEIVQTQGTMEGKTTIENIGKENNQNSLGLEIRTDVIILKLSAETEAKALIKEEQVESPRFHSSASDASRTSVAVDQTVGVGKMAASQCAVERAANASDAKAEGQCQKTLPPKLKYSTRRWKTIG